MLTIIGSCATTPTASTTTSISTTDWVQVFKNAGYVPPPTAKNESAIELIRELPESMQELAGTVTNPLGIRDDILEYTLTTFKDNPKALDAAISYAHDNYWTFLAENKQNAREHIQAMVFSSWCISFYSNFAKRLEYTREVSKLLRNTKLRKKNIKQVESNYLSPGIYGFGNLSDKELAQKCEQGNY
jgi:hypothetical protein